MAIGGDGAEAERAGDGQRGETALEDSGLHALSSDSSDAGTMPADEPKIARET